MSNVYSLARRYSFMPTTKEFALHIIAVAKRKALVQKIANARSRIQAVEKE